MASGTEAREARRARMGEAQRTGVLGGSQTTGPPRRAEDLGAREAERRGRHATAQQKSRNQQPGSARRREKGRGGAQGRPERGAHAGGRQGTRGVAEEPRPKGVGGAQESTGEGGRELGRRGRDAPRREERRGRGDGAVPKGRGGGRGTQKGQRDPNREWARRSGVLYAERMVLPLLPKKQTREIFFDPDNPKPDNSP